jgi:hypothetical protein
VRQEATSGIFVRQVNAEFPQLPGAGDVNDARLECLQLSADAMAISGEKEIEFQVALNSHAQPSAFQFDSPNAVFVLTSGLLPAVHRQWR